MFWKHTSYCNWNEINFSVKLYISGHRLRLKTSIPHHGRPQGGGGKRGHLPPLEIQKYGGPHKDKLTRKN